MNHPTEFDVLKIVCQKLDQAKIPYMLTGSVASNFYSTPRMTRDIDIVVELLKPNLEDLTLLFNKEFYIDKEMIKEAIDCEGMFNIIHNESVFKIDFIIRKHNEYRKMEFQRRRSIKFNGIPICIVSIEDLIISKLFWAKDSSSEMQIKDIRALLHSGSQIDEEYLYDWIQKLCLNHIYEKVTANG
jgi:hypothetical protein